MKISIQRYCEASSQPSQVVDYTIPDATNTLLEALNYIKQSIDATLSFSSGCRSSVCGSCAMQKNGTEVLACTSTIEEGDIITPLKNSTTLRDLIVDAQTPLLTLKKAQTWIHDQRQAEQISTEQADAIALQSDCILCAACYSACPVYATNSEFLGPFALTRVWRYVSDVRENGDKDAIEVVQNSGIWDCTLCNECVPVCPQNIAPKQDIAMLRSKSGTLGFFDPNFSTSNFGGGPSFDGTPDFGGGF